MKITVHIATKHVNTKHGKIRKRVDTNTSNGALKKPQQVSLKGLSMSERCLVLISFYMRFRDKHNASSGFFAGDRCNPGWQRPTARGAKVLLCCQKMRTG